MALVPDLRFTACGQDADVWSHMHARYLALRRACAVSESWNSHQRGALFSRPAARFAASMEINSWQDSQSQVEGKFKVHEDGTCTQGGDETVLTSKGPGSSVYEQEITLVVTVDDDALQSESTGRGGKSCRKTGKEEEVFSAVSSVDTEVWKEQFRFVCPK